MDKRIDWVDGVRGLCIFCVFLTHSDKTDLTFFSTLYRPFFLTLFFLVSGFLYKSSGFFNGLIRIFKGVIVPMIFFSLVYLISHLSPLIGDESFGDKARNIFRLVLMGELYWFLSCLVIVQLLFLILNSLIKDFRIEYKLLIILLCLSSSFCIVDNSGKHLPWNVDTAFYVLSYYIIGTVLKDYYYIVKVKFEKMKIISIFILLFYFFLAYIFKDVYGLVNYNLHDNIFGNVFLAVLLSIIGCFSVLLFSMNLRFGYYLRHLGRSSLVGYCIHGYCFSILNYFLSITKIMFIKDLYPNIFYLLYCFFTGVLIIIIYRFLLHYLPISVGRWPK